MRQFYLISALLLAITLPLSAQVSVISDGSPPDNSAMLDVKSVTRRALFPRIALTEANLASPVTSPAIEGLSGEIPSCSFMISLPAARQASCTFVVKNGFTTKYHKASPPEEKNTIFNYIEFINA